MSELEILTARKRAVELSANLQRSTVIVRLRRIEHHPLQTALGFSMELAGGLAHTLPLRQLAIAALGLGFRYFRRRG